METQPVKTKYIKLAARYLVLVFVLYLAYRVTSPEWLNAVKIASTNLNVVIGAIFGALTLVINGHFVTKVEE